MIIDNSILSVYESISCFNYGKNFVKSTHHNAEQEFYSNVKIISWKWFTMYAQNNFTVQCGKVVKSTIIVFTGKLTFFPSNQHLKNKASWFHGNFWPWSRYRLIAYYSTFPHCEFDLVLLLNISVDFTKFFLTWHFFEISILYIVVDFSCTFFFLT